MIPQSGAAFSRIAGAWLYPLPAADREHWTTALTRPRLATSPKPRPAPSSCTRGIGAAGLSPALSTAAGRPVEPSFQEAS